MIRGVVIGVGARVGNVPFRRIRRTRLARGDPLAPLTRAHLRCGTVPMVSTSPAYDLIEIYRGERFARPSLDDLYAPPGIVESLRPLWLQCVAVQIDGAKAKGRLVLAKDSDTCVLIEWVVAEPRGRKGGRHGQAILQQLIADADGVGCSLRAIAYGRADVLKRIYGGLDFHEVKDGSLVHEPQPRHA